MLTKSVISKYFLKYRHKLNTLGLRGNIFGGGKNMIIKIHYGNKVPFEFPV